MTRKSSFDLALAAMLACVLASPAWANRYRITDLGFDQQVTGINDFGAISAGAAGDGQAKVYRHGSWHTLPGGPGGSEALAINNRGQVAGWAAVGSEDHWYIQPVVWQRDMTKTVLQMPDPEWAGYPQAISDTGFVAGYLYDGGSHPPRCHLWTPWGHGIDIDVGNYCVAHGVDDLARVVGEHQFDGGVHGFLWKAGRMHDLGTLGGSPSIAYAINLRSQVVGASFTAGNERHAFLWHGGKMTDIGNWEDFYDSIAWAINARGEIVGWASRRGQDNRAVRFDHGRIVPLEDEVESLGDWTLWGALGVDYKGAIIGVGTRPGDNVPHSFLLTPVD